METGAEFILAVRESTDAAFEEFNPGAADFIEKLIDYVHRTCDTKGLTGRRRTAVVYLEGMLRGTQLQFVRRKQDAERVAHALGIDVETGLAKGKRES